jgi:hypothetical protein
MVRCYKKQGSNPPICGVHDVKLFQEEIPIDPNMPRLGRILCYLCPSSETVVRDESGPVDSN